MDTSAQLSNGTHYAIPAVTPEKQRLIKQYDLKKSYYGWKAAVPDTVDLSQVRYVLDIAAGTCAWTLDFANTPSIRSRLDRHGVQTKDTDKEGPSIHLYACDIDIKFFPEKELLDDVGVETFQQDVTKPFRQDLYRKFDLVHISMLTLCLTPSGWSEALENCYRLLRPGGKFVIDEADAVLYTQSMPPPSEDAPGHNVEACMSGDGWVHKANRIYTAWALHKGFVIDLTFKLRTMLANAGFIVLESQRVVGQCGKLYKMEHADDAAGGYFDLGDFSVDNMVFILDYFSAGLLQAGALEEKKGVKVTEDTQRKLILQEIRNGLTTDGAMSLGRFCLAVKSQETGSST